jgi:hypothetical protein
MTGLTHIRQCPRCELRFTSSSELEYHLANDHHPRRPVAVKTADVMAPAVAPLLAPPAAEGNGMAAPSRGPRRAAVTLAVFGAAIILLAALFTSTSTMLIVIGLAVLVGSYAWRAHVRRRFYEARSQRPSMNNHAHRRGAGERHRPQPSPPQQPTRH